MTDILRIGTSVTTPLALLGLIAALGYYFYSRHLKHEEKKLEALPPIERARVADQRLSRYGIDGSNISRNDKSRLFADEMEKQFRLARLYAFLFAIVFIICFGFALIGYIYTNIDTTGKNLVATSLLPAEPVQANIDLAIIRGHWDQAVTMLIPLILKNQNRTGGFAPEIGNPDYFPDAWTSAQSITALLSINRKLPSHRPIKNAVQWLTSQKKNDGWVRIDLRADTPSTEVSAWVGLAYEAAIGERVFSDNPSQEKMIIDELRSIHAMLSKRQGPSGAWSSFPIAFPSQGEPIRSRGGYATALAMMFLLHLNKPTYHDTIIDQEALTSQIDKGLRWFFSEYNSKVKGWEAAKETGLHEGLTIMYLLTFIEAKRAGFSKIEIESDRRYREVRKAWLARWVGQSKEREISTNDDLIQYQNIYDQQGVYTDSFPFPVRVLWYPWSLLLVTYLVSDADLPQNERMSAERIQQQLWSRLPQAVDEVTVGQTFRAAETVFVLGMIGKQYGWN